METGNRIKQLRKERNIGQNELACYLGISQASLSKYENEKLKDFSMGMLKKLTDFFQVSFEYMVGLTDERKPKRQVTDNDIMFALFDGKVTQETLEDVKSYAKFIKERKEREKNGEKKN